MHPLQGGRDAASGSGSIYSGWVVLPLTLAVWDGEHLSLLFAEEAAADEWSAGMTHLGCWASSCPVAIASFCHMFCPLVLLYKSVCVVQLASFCLGCRPPAGSPAESMAVLHTRFSSPCSVLSRDCRGPVKGKSALAGVAQWIGYPPTNRKGHWFDSRSGHRSGLWARSPGGGA